MHCNVGPCRSTLRPIRGSALFGALIALPFGRFGAYRSTLWPIRADLLPFRPLSLYPLAISALIALPSGRFGPICCYFGPCRSTLWPFRRLSLYPLVDSGRLVAISTLIALPFCHFGAWIRSLRIRTVLGPLLSYSFQVFKLSHVPPWPRRGKLLAPHRSLGFVFLLEARSSRFQP